MTAFFNTNNEHVTFDNADWPGSGGGGGGGALAGGGDGAGGGGAGGGTGGSHPNRMRPIRKGEFF